MGKCTRTKETLGTQIPSLHAIKFPSPFRATLQSGIGCCDLEVRYNDIMAQSTRVENLTRRGGQRKIRIAKQGDMDEEIRALEVQIAQLRGSS